MRLTIFGATGRLGSLATMAALAAGHEVVSTLAWTALRPALVTDGEPRGYRLSEHLRPGARVTRADVARPWSTASATTPSCDGPVSPAPLTARRI